MCSGALWIKKDIFLLLVTLEYHWQDHVVIYLFFLKIYILKENTPACQQCGSKKNKETSARCRQHIQCLTRAEDKPDQKQVNNSQTVLHVATRCRFQMTPPVVLLTLTTLWFPVHWVDAIYSSKEKLLMWKHGFTWKYSFRLL